MRSEEVIATKRYSPERFSQCVTDSGLSYSEIARRVVRLMPNAKVSASTISGMAEPNANPNVKYLGPIATITNRKVDDFFIEASA